MSRALALASRGLFTTDPNPRVGCVLVRDGVVVGEGWHMRAGEPHAEVLALAAAGAQARGSTAYVSLEPCSHTGRTPPCADALIAAGVAGVVCATIDPNPKVSGAGIKRLRAAGIPVSVGLLADEARALNPGFFSRFERSRPFVRLKMAMSLDARTAHAGAPPPAAQRLWISGEDSRDDVQKLRAQSSAVLTGVGTVRADDPLLNVRLAYGPWVRQPLRVVLDTQLTCSADAQVLGEGALLFAAEDATVPRALTAARVPPAIEHVPRGAGGLDLQAVLRQLNAREVNELLVEAGPRLAASFLAEDLVDELVLYVAPTLLGMTAPPLAALELAAGRAAPRFAFSDVRPMGADLRVVLTPRRP
jgi:diaminohydroxyphosphoribosylaminopyrimidine deaminase/5-amino-6-(5-phosphoribosylamino)uracil reductase